MKYLRKGRVILPALENQSEQLPGFFNEKRILKAAVLLISAVLFFCCIFSAAFANELTGGGNFRYIKMDTVQAIEGQVKGKPASLKGTTGNAGDKIHVEGTNRFSGVAAIEEIAKGEGATRDEKSGWDSKKITYGKDLKRKVILITLDKISLDDLLSYAGPVFRTIMDESAVALMNVNTAGSLSSDSGYLTIGAGARLLGNWSARRAYNRDDTLDNDAVDALYRRHTGSDDLPKGDVLHLYPGVLQRLNEARTYPFLIGALGETLKLNGMHAAVLGNADSSSPNRLAVTIAMDREGSVSYGDVSKALLREKEDFPFGSAGDALAYLNAFESFYEKASLIVVEWGDTRRIDDYLDHLPYSRRGELLRSSFEEFDRFLRGIMPFLVEGTKLIFLTPSPPNSAFSSGQRLTPVISYNPASREQGLLLSASTRRPGIVTNLDIVPSVLDHLGIDEKPVFLFGAPFQDIPVVNHLQELAATSRSIMRIYSQRPPVIKGYLTVQIILLLGGLAGLLYRFKPVKKLIPVYYALLFFPLAVLLSPVLPGFPAESLYVNVFWILGITLLFTALAYLLFKDHLALLSFAGLLVFGTLLLDLLCGAALNSRSFLGYDPIGGARFYGLGNEYMGIMIGSFILSIGSLSSLITKKKISPGQAAGDQTAEKLPLQVHISGEKDPEKDFQQQKVPKWQAVFFWAFIALAYFILFVMASPVYGTNFGGAVTAGVSLAVTSAGLLAFLGRKGIVMLPRLMHDNTGNKKRHAVSFYPQKLYIYLIFILAAGALLYYLNLPRPDAAVSHLGRTLELVRSDGLVELWDIAWRKLEMNYRLVRYSLWSRIMFLFIFLVIFLYYYPVGLSEKIFNEKPGFKAAIGGIIAGTITAFLFNDSGVVAAATIMLYGGLPFLLLCIHEMSSDPLQG